MYHKEEEEAPLHPPVDKGEESDDDDGLSMEFPDVRPVRRFPRVCFRVMGRMLAWITIVGISGLAGAWLALHFVNIDQNCASHTTHWCKYCRTVIETELILTSNSTSPR